MIPQHCTSMVPHVLRSILAATPISTAWRAHMLTTATGALHDRQHLELSIHWDHHNFATERPARAMCNIVAITQMFGLVHRITAQPLIFYRHLPLGEHICWPLYHPTWMIAMNIARADPSDVERRGARERGSIIRTTTTLPDVHFYYIIRFIFMT